MDTVAATHLRDVYFNFSPDLEGSLVTFYYLINFFFLYHGLLLHHLEPPQRRDSSLGIVLFATLHHRHPLLKKDHLPLSLSSFPPSSLPLIFFSLFFFSCLSPFWLFKSLAVEHQVLEILRRQLFPRYFSSCNQHDRATRCLIIAAKMILSMGRHASSSRPPGPRDYGPCDYNANAEYAVPGSSRNHGTEPRRGKNENGPHSTGGIVSREIADGSLHFCTWNHLPRADSSVPLLLESRNARKTRLACYPRRRHWKLEADAREFATWRKSKIIWRTLDARNLRMAAGRKK